MSIAGPVVELMNERKWLDESRGVRRYPLSATEKSHEWTKAQPGRVFPGFDLVSVERAREKYVDPTARYYPFGAGELARLYLDRLIGSRSQLYPLRTLDPDLEGIAPPLYFEPGRGREGRFSYVDIRSAYFQIFKDRALDLIYNPSSGAIVEPWPGVRIPVSDHAWLEQEKPLRHALFGMMQTTGMQWYSGGEWQSVEVLGRYSSPGIVAYTLDRMRQVAQEAIEAFDVRMWLTDAAMLPAKDRKRFMTWLLDRWGLESRVKAEGPGMLYALGDYEVGPWESAHEPHRRDQGFSNLGAACK